MQQNNDDVMYIRKNREDDELDELDLEEFELFREFLSRKYGRNVERRLHEELNKKNKDVKKQ